MQKVVKSFGEESNNDSNGLSKTRRWQRKEKVAMTVNMMAMEMITTLMKIICERDVICSAVFEIK